MAGCNSRILGSNPGILGCNPVILGQCWDSVGNPGILEGNPEIFRGNPGILGSNPRIWGQSWDSRGQSWDSGGQSWDSWGQFLDSGAILGFPGAKFQFNVTHVDTFAFVVDAAGAEVYKTRFMKIMASRIRTTNNICSFIDIPLGLYGGFVFMVFPLQRCDPHDFSKP